MRRIHEVISQSNPLALYSSGDTDTEQGTAGDDLKSSPRRSNRPVRLRRRWHSHEVGLGRGRRLGKSFSVRAARYELISFVRTAKINTACRKIVRTVLIDEYMFTLGHGRPA